MTLRESPEKELPPAKRRKLDSKSRQGVSPDQDEPLYPFRLVPSPQEARSLETSTSPFERFLKISGSLGDIYPCSSWSSGTIKVTCI